MIPTHRTLTACERLWLAVLDQACMDASAQSRTIRREARDWWATETPKALAEYVGIPWSRVTQLRARRGGLRTGITHRRGHHIPPGRFDEDEDEGRLRCVFLPA